MKRILYLTAGTLAYFSWFYFFVGLRPEHVFLFVLVVGLYWAGGGMRRFVLAFSAFIIYWILYDSMRVVPNHSVNPVHIAEPYEMEKWLFGVNTAAGRVTLNEYFLAHGAQWLDVVSGLFYLCWIPLPLAFGVWLFRNNKPLFVRFSYGFLFANTLGFVIYYLYPAAPPWYVEQYGFELKEVLPGNAAGLLRFDAFFGISLFANIYTKASNVFAAIPSLHAAYPVLCLLYGRQLGRWWLNLLFGVFVAGIWFAAIYTRHHYTIDVLLGGMVATGGYLLFGYLSAHTRVKQWLEALLRQI